MTAFSGSKPFCPHIGREGIQARDIATGVLTSGLIATGAITKTKIGALAVSTSKVMTGAITKPKLAVLSVSNAKIVTGTISMGAGTHLALVGKLDARFVSALTAATNSNTVVSHGLARPPIGFEVLSQDKSCMIYDGTTAHTTTLLNFRATQSSVTVKLMVL